MVKRIYNPVTKNYYIVTQRIRNSSNGKEIKGIWKSKFKSHNK